MELHQDGELENSDGEWENFPELWRIGKFPREILSRAMANWKIATLPQYARRGFNTLDLNTASVKQIANRTPLVGEKIAKKLVDSRPFRNWDEVSAVPLIGPERLENLQKAFHLEVGADSEGKLEGATVFAEAARCKKCGDEL